MAQSPFPGAAGNGFHIAIVMDGNGRRARQRGMPRLLGHRTRRENVRRIVSACPDRGMCSLTRTAFVTENWERPQPEVDGRMRILGEFIDRATCNHHSEGLQIRHPGQHAGLLLRLQRNISRAVDLTEANTRLTLAVALTSAGWANRVAAVRALAAAGIDPGAFDEQTISNSLSTSSLLDLDLIIHTSGEGVPLQLPHPASSVERMET